MKSNKIKIIGIGLILLSILLFSCSRKQTTLIILQDENGVPMDTLYFEGERIN